MRKLLAFLMLFCLFGLGASAQICEGPNQYSTICPEHYSCQLVFGEGNKCVRFECDSEQPISEWRNTEFCDDGKRIQERTWQRYAAFPDCAPFFEFEQQLVSIPECVLCDSPTVISSEQAMGCARPGLAQYRQQVRVCSIKNNEKQWVDAERIITKTNPLCYLPLAGSYLINPILAIVLLIVLILIVSAIILLKKKR